MALSYVNYPADGSVKQFAVTFGYLRRSHVFVFVDNNLTAFKWVSGTNIEIDPAPAEGAEVRIQRLTDKTNRITDFSDGQTLLAEDLDAAALQNFYLAQEVLDGIVDGVLQGDVILNQPLVSGDPLTLQSIQGFIDEASRNSPVIETLLSDVGANAASISQEIADRIADTTARLADIANLQAQIDVNTSGLAQEVTDRSAAAAANAAAIAQEATERAADFTALVGQIDTERSDRVAGLVAEAEARGIVERSLDSLYSQTGAALAAIVAEMEARASEDETLAAVTSLLKVQLGAAEASILEEQSARVAALSTVENDLLQAIAAEAGLRAADVASIATDIQTVRTDFGNADAAISTNLNALTSDHLALASQVSTLEATFITGDFTAAIGAEATARSDADAALAELIELVRAETEENTSLAFSAVAALVTEDESTSRRIESFQSSFDSNVARVDTELSTLATATAANASSIAALSATLGTAQADIVANQSAIVDEASARATDVASLQSQIDGNSGSITVVNEALTSSLSALSRRQEAFSAEFAAGLALVLSEVEARADEDESLSMRIDVVSAETEGNAAAIVAEQSARTTAVGAVASDVTALTARVTTAEGELDTAEADITTAQGDIITLQEVTATTSAALAREASSIRTEFAAAFAAVYAETEVRSSELEAAVIRTDALQARLGSAEADILTVDEARVSGDAANALSISTVATDLGTTNTNVGTLQSAQSTFEAATARDLQFQLASLAGVLAGALSEIETRATENEAVVTSIDELSVNLENNYATITTVQQVEATANDAQTRASAIYGIRSDVNGYVTGFGLSNDGDEGEFAVMADRFLVVDPASAASGEGVQAFVVQNGSLYVNSAFIANLNANVITAGTFSAARLASASVEARHIKADEVWTQRLYLGNNDLELDGTTGTLRHSDSGSVLVEVGDLGGGDKGIVVRDMAGTPMFQSLADGTTEIDGAFIKSATVEWAAIKNVVIEEADIGDATIGAIKLKSGAVGAMVSASQTTHDLYTGTSNDPKTPGVFNDLEISTPFLEVSEGELLRINVSYEVEAEYDCLQWFLFRDKIELRGSSDGGITDFYLGTAYVAPFRELRIGRTNISAPLMPNAYINYTDPFARTFSVLAPATGAASESVTHVKAILSVGPFAPPGNTDCRIGGPRPERIKDTLAINNPVIELEKFSSGFTVS